MRLKFQKMTQNQFQDGKNRSKQAKNFSEFSQKIVR